MKSERVFWRDGAGWSFGTGNRTETNLVIYFGGRVILGNPARFAELCAAYPQALVVGCSTGGQIDGADITDDGITALAVNFDNTSVGLAKIKVTATCDCHALGGELAQQLLACSPEGKPLAGVFVLSDGLAVNGSRLVGGMIEILGRDLPIMGGLAGDGADFIETLVGADAAPETSIIAAVGFYGDKLRIGHGNAGGWDVFGPRRNITSSQANVLLELDGEPALDLYERYLGEDESKGLPGTALLFPLMLRDPLRNDHEVVRTVLAIDRDARSMTFAGDIPQGWTAQLMRGNFDRLSQGAGEAARAASGDGLGSGTGLSVMISCIGRRLLMGQRIHEELEAALAELPDQMPNIGFYSYGEISPHAASGFCELHNQTMTVMTLSEAA